MRALIVSLVVGVLVVTWYLVEPYAVTFVDDGPYYSSEFSEPITELPVYSQLELWRFGQLVYRLESRLLSSAKASVLVLKNAQGTVKWARQPIKPDGELGPLKLRRSNLTWYGGWRIGISPHNRKGGIFILAVLVDFDSSTTVGKQVIDQ